jgi:branched-chain amino acid aminotransferase
MIVFFKGRFLADDNVPLSPADRGLTLGDGVFDTLLAVDGQLRHAALHFERLLTHAAVLRIRNAETVQSLTTAAERLLAENRFIKDRYALRTTLTRGAGARGLMPPEQNQPTLLMRASPAPENPPPVHAVIARTTRRNEHSPLSRIKSINYGDNLLALLEAKDRGANEAILLNTAGDVACATAGNIFIREKGRLLTPPLSDGALDGITRRLLLEKEGREQTLTPEHLRNADEIYITNSLQGVRPVGQLEDKNP